MIPAIVAFWAMAAPAGYLAGAAWMHNNEKEKEFSWMPLACGLFTPLGAVIALVVLTQSETEKDL